MITKITRGVLLLVFAAILIGLLTSCAEPTDALPAPESDSKQQYKDGSKLPVDTNVYLMRVQIVGELTSLTKTESVMSGSLYGSSYNNYGSVSGSISAQTTTTGKGFVRALIMSIEPDTEYGRVGGVVILKTTDTKLTKLEVGDQPLIMCRLQAEALAAVLENQTFDASFITWEFDFCRQAVPEIFYIKRFNQAYGWSFEDREDDGQ